MSFTRSVSGLYRTMISRIASGKMSRKYSLAAFLFKLTQRKVKMKSERKNG